MAFLLHACIAVRADRFRVFASLYERLRIDHSVETAQAIEDMLVQWNNEDDWADEADTIAWSKDDNALALRIQRLVQHVLREYKLEENVAAFPHVGQLLPRSKAVHLRNALKRAEPIFARNSSALEVLGTWDTICIHYCDDQALPADEQRSETLHRGSMVTAVEAFMERALLACRIVNERLLRSNDLGVGDVTALTSLSTEEEIDVNAAEAILDPWRGPECFFHREAAGKDFPDRACDWGSSISWVFPEETGLWSHKLSQARNSLDNEMKTRVDSFLARISEAQQAGHALVCWFEAHTKESEGQAPWFVERKHEDDS